jgi:hypothetical protein
LEEEEEEEEEEGVLVLAACCFGLDGGSGESVSVAEFCFPCGGAGARVMTSLSVVARARFAFQVAGRDP